ncbi:hypothetical protein, partial [Cyanothece sp. BG0011]|uniref:hypothetical protein n=1 Tax=Cyanothece sp. BG0011 TaxID=2082950 RepID=UPI001E3D609A
GESEIYDDVVNSLLQYHQIITSQTDLCNSLVDEINSLLEENTRLKDSIKQLLKDIGISPNQIPD